MTATQWDKLSDSEKSEHLRTGKHKIKSRSFMNGKKKVGDYSAISKKYALLVGGVNVSGWCESEDKARDEGYKFLSLVLEE